MRISRCQCLGEPEGKEPAAFSGLPRRQCYEPIPRATGDVVRRIGDQDIGDHDRHRWTAFRLERSAPGDRVVSLPFWTGTLVSVAIPALFAALGFCPAGVDESPPWP